MSSVLDREREDIERVEYLMERGAVFVFGSNRRGAHGAGASRVAHRKWRAAWGKGEGPTGRCYAIPTKDANIRTLPLDEIRKHVERFKEYAAERPEATFAVSRIGCGLAGYTDEQIAPMFADAPLNCELPNGWRGDL